MHSLPEAAGNNRGLVNAVNQIKALLNQAKKADNVLVLNERDACLDSNCRVIGSFWDSFTIAVILSCFWITKATETEISSRGYMASSLVKK